MTANSIARKLLPVVLLVALAVRLWGLGFGHPYASTRPDETAVAGPAVHMLSGDLRPPDFLYPSFLYYVVAALYAGWYVVTRPFGMYASLAAFAESRRVSLIPFFTLSRGLSAVLGTLTVWWVYSICRRCFDETVAIVAAFFTALAYLHVRDSHFGTTDVPMTAFVVLSVLLTVRWQETGSPARAAAAAVAAGLAASTKYNGLGAVVPFAIAVLLRAIDEPDGLAAGIRRNAGAAAVYGATFVAAFFAGSPYALLQWPRFVEGLRLQLGAFEAGRGVVETRGWWSHGLVTLPAALGWPLYAAGVAGVAGSLAREPRRAAVVFAFPIAYFLVAGSGHRIFARDVIPTLPFLCAGAGWLVVSAGRRLVGVTALWRFHAALAIAAVLIVAIPARNVVLVDRLLTRADNRVVAAREIGTLIPSGSLIYRSGGAFGRLPLEQFSPQFSFSECYFDEARGGFSNGGRLPDWIILQRSPLVLYSHIPPAVEQLVHERYDMVRLFEAQRGDNATYDQQDALFIPLTGLDAMVRPGPNFEVYGRRGRTPASH